MSSRRGRSIRRGGPPHYHNEHDDRGGSSLGDRSIGVRWTRGGRDNYNRYKPYDDQPRYRGGRGRDGAPLHGEGGEHGGCSSGGSMKREEEGVDGDSDVVILKVLRERFDSENKSLNLSDILNDRTLLEHGIHGSMVDAVFVNTILDLIKQHFPGLKSLDLSKNRLQRLEHYHSLGDKCPHLETLILADNELRSVHDLEKISAMNSVTSLLLAKNPFIQNKLYFEIGNIRRTFPNLQLLDDQRLPSPVKFDLSPVHSGSLPPTQKGFLKNDDIQKIVTSFLERYYQFYDGERESLLDLYNQKAVFSLAVSPHQTRYRLPSLHSWFSVHHRYRDGPSLVRYLQESRNLKSKLLGHAAMVMKLLKRGRLDIVQCLRDLPKTYHHSSSFCMDVLQASSTLTAFTVHGMFSEVMPGSSPDLFPVRAFTRTFVIMTPTDTRSATVINDQLMIRNARQQSVEAAHEELSKLPRFN